MFPSVPTGFRCPNTGDFIEVLTVPVFIEPMDYSGELLCAGAVGYGNGRAYRSHATHLLRYRCVFGSAVATLEMVGELALQSLESHLTAHDGTLECLASWIAPASGLSLGEPTVSTARTLEEAVADALAGHAVAVATGDHLAADVVVDRYASMSSTRLEKEVKDVVTRASPALYAAFGRQFRVREGARPLSLGFCGHRLVANFVTMSPKQLTGSVRMCKAKLWDLEQARDDRASRGWFEVVPQHFELILNVGRPPSRGAASSDAMDEAVAELQYEAGLKDMTSRPLASPDAIGQHILAVEQAN